MQHGDTLKGYYVICAHNQMNLSVVLAWGEHKREYVVWTVGPDAEPFNGTYRFDLNDAMNEYSERVMSSLYSHYNRIAPTFTYERRNEQS